MMRKTLIFIPIILIGCMSRQAEKEYVFTIDEVMEIYSGGYKGGVINTVVTGGFDGEKWKSDSIVMRQYLVKYR